MNKIITKNKELYLIIQLLRYQFNKSSALQNQIRSLASDQMLNPDEFIRMIEFHKVFTHVYEAVKELDCFPEVIVNNLKDLNIKNIKFNLNITSELIKLNRVLSENNINFTVLKGQPLSVLLYGNTTQRSSGDIDILIEDDDIDKIFSIFECYYIFLPPKKNLPLKYIKKYYHHLVFKNKQSNVHVEVHTKLFHHGYLLPSFHKKAEENIESIKVSGDYFNIFSFHWNLFYILMHGSGHQWYRLFWLNDIAEYCRNEQFDINKLLNLSEQFGVIHAVVSSLFLCSEIFNIPKIDGKLKEYTQDFKIRNIIDANISCIISNKTIKEQYSFIQRIPFYSKTLLNDFRLLGSWKCRIKPLMNLLFLFFFLCPVYAALSWFRLRFKK